MSQRPVSSVQISLNDLPKFSDWPQKLLSLESFEIKHKTEREVLREYQDEKWGHLLKQVRTLTNPTLRQIDTMAADFNARFPCYEADAFYLANEQQMLDRHLELYADVLTPYLDGASCLVELGAGYGSKLFGLAQREGFSRIPLIAGEYTQSGRDLISILAESLRRPVAVGHCDFRTLTIEGITIPEDAVIFTSYAVHYVPQLSMDFVRFLSALRPRVVVHFEPCYEHYPMDQLHGLMCRRYVELNDYTRNLVTVIDGGRTRDGVSLRVRKNVVGTNPFLPISVLEWSPVGSQIPA